MAQIIAGPGMTAPLPQNLYPSELYNAPLDAPSNYIAVAAGDAIPLPAQSTSFLLDLGQFLSLEYLDAVTGVWRPTPNFNYRSGAQVVTSDGVSRRITNRLGCPVGAIVANGGTSFTQATATLTANTGGSTWIPIIGGSLSVSTISAAGANYTVPPIVLIPDPTPAGYSGSVGGIPATAYAAVSANTVSAVSFDNFGAGYVSAPTPILVPSPYDVNFASISQATVVFSLANTGAVTGALCTNFGAPLATLTALTLTAAGGAGSGATITPQILQTITAATVVAGGTVWGTASAFAGVMAMGGGPSATTAASIANPAIDMSGFKPSVLLASGTTNAGGTITAVTFPNGGGLFLSAPTAAVISGGTIPTGLASITFTMGTNHGLALIQPL